MSTTVHLKVNGQAHDVSVEPGTMLIYVLRDNLGLHGPKFGCGLSQCGACTVHLDGKAVHSCVMPVEAAQGHAVTTLEGLGTIDHPDPLQQAFIDEQAVQCGCPIRRSAILLSYRGCRSTRSRCVGSRRQASTGAMAWST
ncbi:MAG: 2Fe-2S iron-sulfur cluster binding domain-containing protein [Proteobacteria bacterium]|nr:2Fe-2S iron-sulfur cluster binding domain-containing protein [Pseudomonadota bacterium]